MAVRTDVASVTVADTKISSSPPLIKGLLADGPEPELREKLMLFGQFVGDWEIDATTMQPDGTWVQEKGEVHYAWILDGWGVQDVWIGYDDNSHRKIAWGTTVRFYDSEIDAWQCVWITPRSRAVRTFVAREMGEEIVLEGTTKEGFPDRWLYSEITPRSFRWRSVESHDNKKTWQPTQEMSIHRSKTNP